MTCDQSSFLLEKRWDHALTLEEEIALDQHLEGCDNCRAEAQAIALADEAFLALPDLEPPMDIARAVAARIKEEAVAEPRRGWFWGGAAALAALFATVLHFGIPLPAAWFDRAQSPYLAVTLTWFSAIGHRAGDALGPAGIVLKTVGLLALKAAPVLLLLVIVEMALVSLWAMRRRVSGHAARV